MKSISFLRTTWRKKDNKSSTTESIPNPPKQAFTEVTPVPTLPQIDFGEGKSTMFPQFDPAAQVQHPRAQERVNPTPHPDHQRFVTEKSHLTASRSNRRAPEPAPRIRGYHGSVSNNPSHDPPSFDRSGKQPSSGSSTPHRPQVPPFLSRRPHTSQGIGSATGSVPRSPTHVKFAETSQTRSPRPNSPLRQSFDGVSSNGNHRGRDAVSSKAPPKDASSTSGSQESRFAYFSEPVPGYSQESAASYAEDNSALSDHDKTPSTFKRFDPAALPTNTLELKSEGKHSARVHDDRSELRNPRTLYHATASTPHQPFTKSRTTRRKSESTREEMGSSYPLALFPSPPPNVHKRPKPLVLPPTPTMAPPSPPSPILSSTDSTPLATPTTPYSSSLRKPQSTISLSKTTTRMLSHNILPPTSPPGTPLPTPPTSSSYDAAVARLPVPLAACPPRSLHSAQSTMELRDFRANLNVERRRPSSAQKTTATPGMQFRGDGGRRRANSRPEPFTSTTSTTYLQSKGRAAPKPISSPDINWGYAV